jgi:hypothetical protein
MGRAEMQIIVRRVLGLSLICVACIAAAQDTETFAVRLSPMPLDAEIRTLITGSGSGTAVLEGRRLVVDGSFSGLQGPATVARLHAGLAMGIRGPAVLDLEVDSAVSGTFSGELRLEREHLEALRDRRLYIQIHSESAPDGNLWGWLLP